MKYRTKIITPAGLTNVVSKVVDLDDREKEVYEEGILTLLRNGGALSIEDGLCELFERREGLE